MWSISLFLKILAFSILNTVNPKEFYSKNEFSILNSQFSIKTDHPVHSSGCLIEWNEQERTFEISLKVFSDDLDMIVSKQAGKKLFLGTEYETTNADEYLKPYLKEHFKLALNDQPIEWEFLGKEVKRKGDFEIWIYLQVANVEEVHKLNITQSILTEHYADQSNYVNTIVRGEKKGLVLGMNYPSGEIIY